MADKKVITFAQPKNMSEADVKYFNMMRNTFSLGGKLAIILKAVERMFFPDKVGKMQFEDLYAACLAYSLNPEIFNPRGRD